MKKEVLTGLLVLVLNRDGYLGFEVTQEVSINTSDSLIIPYNGSFH